MEEESATLLRLEPALDDRTLVGTVVRHPPQSEWPSEWGRLKGGHPGGLGGALKRALGLGLELSS
jgi:hypothetical protein